jgi:phosphopantetheinyl transferase
VLFRHDESDNAVKRSANNRVRKKLGASLMRTALAQETSVDAWRWTIGNQPSGQPMIASGPHSASRTKISLSHSGPFFAAAASSCDALGVDIEIVRKRRFREIAEYSNWPSSTWDNAADLPASRFFRLWTLWEATIKATSSYADSDRERLFAKLVKQTSSGQPSSLSHNKWSVRSWQWADECWVTVVARLPEAPRIRLYELNSSPLNDRNLDLRRIDDPSDILISSPDTAGAQALR